jgi:transposase-like protein
MEDFTLKETKSLLTKTLEEIARAGAQKMLKRALEVEVSEFIENYDKLRDSKGCRFIRRNGYHKSRNIVTGIGNLQVKVPRVRDLRNDSDNSVVFNSSIVPKYLRRAEKIEDLIPFLYLKGISSGHFSEVLSKLSGSDISVSSNTALRLTSHWEQEHEEWSKRDLSKKEYIYWWADGVYFNVRNDNDKSCILVIIGATRDGKKELIAVQDGFRENELSWSDILLNLKNMGLKSGPKLAIGDGSLGFWDAISKHFPKTKHQRCWVHRTANVINKLPKFIQKEAKRDIYDIYLAPNKKDALKAFDKFVKKYEAKYPKAVKCLLKTKKQTLAFYDFPAEHWRHIRSTNPIESTFATVRLRTYKTRACCKRTTIFTMVFKLVQAAEKKWQKLYGYKLIEDVLKGVRFIDGVRHAA